MVSERKIKVLMAKMGLDVHDNGVQTVTRMLRDAGMEVIYAGLYNSSEGIVKTTIEEDVDVVGISFLAPSYLSHTTDLMRSLKESNVRVLVTCGGIIKTKDIYKLKQLGIGEVFLPGSTKDEIVGFIEKNVSKR